jgi:hypothetical protein
MGWVAQQSEEQQQQQQQQPLLHTAATSVGPEQAGALHWQQHSSRSS